MATILPLGNDEGSRDILLEADRLFRQDPAQLTLLHLRHLQTYAPHLVTDAERRRDAALEQRQKAADSLRIPAPAPPEPPFVSAFIDLLADSLKQRDDQLAALEARLAALETSAKNQGHPVTSIRSWPAA
jgi:hypothetical protein